MPLTQTLSGYRTEVRRLLHDATGKFWSDAELNDYINAARDRVCADTGCIRSLVIARLTPGVESYPIGGVTGAAVTSPGAGYVTPTLTFTGGGGSGAAGTLTVAGGAITGVVITSPGSGYISVPTAVITPSFGVVTGLSVALTSAGFGYTSRPTLGFSGGGGSGAAGTVDLQAEPAGQYTGGSGYTIGDVLTATGGAFVRPLKIMAMSTGGLTNWIVLDPGDYTAPPGIPGTFGTINAMLNVQLSGGTGTGAAVICVCSLVNPVVTSQGTGYASAPAVTVSGGSPNVNGTVVASIGAGVSAAVITPTIIPATALDILNVTPIIGNQRVPLGYMPFTEFNARMRTLTANPNQPIKWSKYGSSGGAAMLQPVPNQAFVTEFDTAVLAPPLVNDGDVDAIAYPYITPVAFYAAWKAKLKQQSYGEATSFLNDYRTETMKAQAAVAMRRVPNPYAGYSGG